MEVVALKVCDIDSKRMMLRVEQGKGHKDRQAMPSLLASWGLGSDGVDVVGAIELAHATLRKMHQNLWWAVGSPIRTSTCQDSDELDGLGDHRAWNRYDGFLDQLLHSAERAEC